MRQLNNQKTTKTAGIKTVRLLILGMVILFFSTTSCIDDFTIRGNGISATEGRITTDFHKVKSSGAFDVHITNGAETEVVVIAEENIIQYIETYVSGNTLNIDIQGLRNVKNRLPMEVYITTPELNGIKQSGSGQITSDYFYSSDVEIVLSGSGNISTAFESEEIDALISGSGRLELFGVAERGDFSISGSGRIGAYEMSLRSCEAKISGSGSMWINAEQYIHAAISGSGNVHFYGNPEVDLHVSGSGDVIHEN